MHQYKQFLPKVLRNLIDILFVFQQLYNLKQVRSPQLRDRYPARPGPVDTVKYPSNHLEVQQNMKNLIHETKKGVGNENESTMKTNAIKNVREQLKLID